MAIANAPSRPLPPRSTMLTSEPRTAPLPLARVLVVDALPVVGIGLRALIDAGSGMTTCGIASTMADALKGARQIRPDIVVLDGTLDTYAGGARALCSDTPGAQGDHPGRRATRDTYPHAAALAGARGIIPRLARSSTIIATIRAVRGGAMVVDPTLAHLLDEPRTTARPMLSGRQAAVLALVADGYTTIVIAETMVVSVETARTHPKAIPRHLDLHDRAHAVARGYELGLLRCPTTYLRHRLEGDTMTAILLIMLTAFAVAAVITDHRHRTTRHGRVRSEGTWNTRSDTRDTRR